MRSTIRIIRKFNRMFTGSEKKRFFFLYVLMFIGAILEMLSVSMIVPLMLALIGGESERFGFLGSFSAVFSGTDNVKLITAMLIFLIILYLTKNLYLCFEYWIQSKFINACKVKTKKQLLSAYLSREYAFYLQANTGEIIRVINSDTEGVFYLLKGILSMSIECIVAALLFFCLVAVSPLISLSLCVLLSLEVLLISKVLDPLIKKASTEAHKYQSRSNSWVLQIFQGIKEVYVSDKREFFIDQYDIDSRRATEPRVKADFLTSLPRSIIEAVTMSGMLLFVLIYVANGHSVTALIPALSAFVMAAIRLLPSFNRVSNAKTQMAYYETDLDKVLEVLEQTDNYNLNPLNAQKEKLNFQKECHLSEITYTYPEATAPVLKNANMTIPVGSFVGVIGKSGAGKTTTADILLNLLKPQEGKVLADGKAVTNTTDWLSHIGYIPQSIFLLNASIEENVAFGVLKEEIDKNRVEEVLKQAQLWDFVQTLPKGMDTVVGERGIRLSGGQRQRIGIARALYQDPELLVFDEATSSLDPETETNLMEAINTLHGNKTLVVITHRLSTLKDCDILYKVENDTIVRVDKLGSKQNGAE